MFCSYLKLVKWVSTTYLHFNKWIVCCFAGLFPNIASWLGQGTKKAGMCMKIRHNLDAYFRDFIVKFIKIWSSLYFCILCAAKINVFRQNKSTHPKLLLTILIMSNKSIVKANQILSLISFVRLHATITCLFLRIWRPHILVNSPLSHTWV